MAFRNPLHFEFSLKRWPFWGGSYSFVTFGELGPRQQHFLPYCEQVHVLDALGAAMVNKAQCQEADIPVVS